MEMLNGRTYWVYSRFLQVNGQPLVAEIVKDITENLYMDSNQRDQLGMLICNYNQMLISDSLTGVYNRRFLDEHFLPSLKCCHEEQIAVNLAFIDIDHFKEINDQYGHNAGDALLKDASGFWKLHFNSREKGRERLVIRFGGDEILIVACGIPIEQFEAEIQHDYGQMRKVCYYTNDIQFPFQLAIGVASSKELGADWSWNQLLELADQRMYGEKTKRKNSAGTERKG